MKARGQHHGDAEHKLRVDVLGGHPVQRELVALEQGCEQELGFERGHFFTQAQTRHGVEDGVDELRGLEAVQPPGIR